MFNRVFASSCAAVLLAAGAASAQTPAVASAQGSSTVTVTGCLVRQTRLGAAYTPGQGGNQNGDLVLTKSAVAGDPGPATNTTTTQTAVPGSAPSGSGTGTINQSASSVGQAPVDAQERSFALTSARAEELHKLVGQRVELVGTLQASATAGTSGREDVRATGSTPATTDRDRERSSAAPAGATGSAGPGSRSEGETAPVAHPSAPVERLTVTSFRPVSGTCPQ